MESSFEVRLSSIPENQHRSELRLSVAITLIGKFPHDAPGFHNIARALEIDRAEKFVICQSEVRSKKETRCNDCEQ